MNFKYTLRSLLLGSVALSLAGCDLAAVGQSERAAGATQQTVADAQTKAISPLPAASSSAVTVNTGMWLGSLAEESQHGQPLPYTLETPNGVTIKQAQPLNLQQIAAILTKYTQIPVSLAPDLTSSGGSTDTSSQPQASSLGSTLASLGVASSGATVQGNTNGSNGSNYISSLATSSYMPINYTGPLSQLLDMIASNFDDAWTFNGTSITISKNVVQVYSVHALPSTIDLTTQLNVSSVNQGSSSGSGSNDNGSTGNAQSSAASKASVKIWSDIEGGLKAIVGGNGTIASQPSTGTVTVTAPPSVAKQVEAFMDEQNKRLSNEVAVTVQVLSIQLTNTDNFQFNVNAALKSGGNSFGLGNVSEAASLSNPAIANAGTFAFDIVKGGLAGTTGALSALSSLGKVSVVTTGTITTVSGIPAPLQNTNTRGYLASLATQTIPDGTTETTQTTMTPGSVTTGFNMSVLPLVNYNTRSVLLQYAVDMASLNGSDNGFDTFTSNGNEIQLPNVNQQDFIQQAEIPDGATLVLSGYGQTSDTASKKGQGSPDFFLLGGGQSGTHQQEGIVILITPVVLNTGGSVITKD